MDFSLELGSLLAAFELFGIDLLFLLALFAAFTSFALFGFFGIFLRLVLLFLKSHASFRHQHSLALLARFVCLFVSGLGLLDAEDVFHGHE